MTMVVTTINDCDDKPMRTMRMQMTLIMITITRTRTKMVVVVALMMKTTDDIYDADIMVELAKTATMFIGM